MINQLNKDHHVNFDSMTSEELSDKMEEVRRKWERRCEEKREMQVTLAKNKALLIGRMDYEKKQNLFNARNSVLARMQFVESQIMWTKRMMREITAARHGRKSPETTSEYQVLKKGCIESLVALRGKYQEFAADNTRVSSMKDMAAKFVLELNPIIRASVNAKENKKEYK
tara:strand:+ start:207 stop:716 length:510 start_codon:yes stop_codon:yes gene_type:complete